ncbi:MULTISPECIES: HNH endonuclease signature motif containing protein [unclassified Arcicella]|uniref:HNH endonuclease n=1 Tax=unclassified Arcicella TaxID=2644986 RepID=UPI00285E580B|nr:MULTISPECIES: HNH endonuclease signature motif containing protein [unclassified Arcicella]MDR6562984.1 hypothetical protein [Arcicella sp. BE51]MDR6813068.1 hypothetical protein [Arcicella sp. BE140]MDR6824382.1 hypothetical protein [Arcicella sp. BE139]
MRKTISTHIKNQVALRANFHCEYCLQPEQVSFFSFHIDHIISIKHGGNSYLNNLAYCCPDCNHAKGSDIASIIKHDILVRFFNPRKDSWKDNFDIIDGAIIGKTEIGKVTERIFKFNELERLIFRKQLIALQLYI